MAVTRPVKTPAKIGFLSYIADTQGCGTIRVIYPYLLLNHYRQKDVFVHSSWTSFYINDPKYYENFSVVQFQRSATEAHRMLHDQFRKTVQTHHKIPLIYEIDDLLMGIPEWNFAHEWYAPLGPHIEYMMSKADGIVTSTNKLKEIYSKYNSKIEIIENHLPKFIWGDIYPKHDNYPREKKPVVLWAGSQNHFALKHHKDKGIKGGDFSDKLLDFIRKTTDKYRWTFVGGIPLELNDIKNKIEVHRFQRIFNYAQFIKDIEPDIAIAPLMPGTFNESKSNIKQLEMIAVGAAGVYTDIEPYKKAYLKCKSDEEMISHVEKLSDDIDFRKKVWNKEYNACKMQLWWEEHNNIRNYINTYLRFFNRKLP